MDRHKKPNRWRWVCIVAGPVLLCSSQHTYRRQCRQRWRIAFAESGPRAAAAQSAIDWGRAAAVRLWATKFAVPEFHATHYIPCAPVHRRSPPPQSRYDCTATSAELDAQHQKECPQNGGVSIPTFHGSKDRIVMTAIMWVEFNKMPAPSIAVQRLKAFLFPVPTKKLSYDSCVTITIHCYCLDTCGPCNN